MSLNLETGTFSSGAHPTRHQIPAILREAARNLAGGASLDLRFSERHFYRRNATTGEDELLPAFELLADCDRPSGKAYPSWSGRSGDPVGRLVGFAAHERATGDFGPLDEAAGENFIRNARGEGGVPGAVGSGGAAPEYWSDSFTATALTYGAATRSRGWPVVPVSISGGSDGDSEFIFLEEVDHVAAVQNDVVTFSIVARVFAGSLAGLDGVQLQINEHDAAGASVGNSFAAGNLEMTDQGLDGTLRRFTFTYTVQSATAAAIRPVVRFMIGTGAQVSAGLWLGAPQLEAGDKATSPMLAPVGSPGNATRAADVISGATAGRASRAYVANWDGKSGSVFASMREVLPGVSEIDRRGLRVSEGTTNKIRNARGLGSGAAPDHWSVTNTAGGTVTKTGVGEEDGCPYTQWRWVGTVNGDARLSLEDVAYIAAAAGQDWTFSAGVRIVGGSADNIAGIRWRLFERDNGNGLIATQSTAVFPLDGQHRRHWEPATLTEDDTVAMQPVVEIRSVAVGDVDIEFRIYAPQVENKAFATMPMLAAPGEMADAVRADAVPEFDVGSWLGSVSGCIVAEFQTAVAEDVSSRSIVFALDDDSFDNIVCVWLSNASPPAVRARHAYDGGGDAWASGSSVGVDAGNGPVRVAISFEEGEAYLSVKDAAGVTYSETIPAFDARVLANVSRLALATDTAGRPLNGWLSRLTCFDYRPTDAVVDALVA